ncbi:MAG TPA: ATP-binding protein [Solirubrobacteraceae bacterium]
MAKIKPQPNEFDDHILDLFGQEFRFDHAKGLAEWLKNSADAYNRAGVDDDAMVILIELHERNPKKNSVFRVIDFVGMTHDDLEKALKRWGDPKAATRGAKRNVKTLGGHGNGGKFYARQSFKHAMWITYREGKLNVFGFEEKVYGFVDGYEDRDMDLAEALEYAGISIDELTEDARVRLGESGGFTVVYGDQPENFSRGATSRNIIEKLLVNPQARRPLLHNPVYARFGKNLGVFHRLQVVEPEGRVDFNETYHWEIPDALTDANGGEHLFRDKQYPEAWLELKVASDTLRPKGADRIDISGETSVIASYATHELGGMVPAQAEFLHGECYCPKLEDPEDDLVKNDREKLAEGDKSRVLLSWIRDKVAELGSEIAKADAKNQQHANLERSAAYNELLNKWKNKFMSESVVTLFGGPGEGSGFGGGGQGEGGHDDPDDPNPVPGPDDPDDPNPSVGNAPGGTEGGDGDQERPKRRAPVVLLSSQDADPFDELGMPLTCSPRHPAVYQRPEDAVQNIYWINTSTKLAQKILETYGADHSRWRDYMFQRYVEIILKEYIRDLGQKGELTSDLLDGEIDKLYALIHDKAEEDLSQFLFDEKTAA